MDPEQFFETRDKIQFRCFLAFARGIDASGIVPLPQQLVDVYDQRYRFFDFMDEGSKGLGMGVGPLWDDLGSFSLRPCDFLRLFPSRSVA